MNKNIFLLLLTGLLFNGLSAQLPSPIWVVDFVKTKSDRRAETLFFYENNWKLYRDTALARGHISAYRLLETQPDSLGNFDFILMTAYPDSASRAKSEEHFQPILRALRPDGPRLLNDWKPNDFRKNIFFKDCRTVFEAQAKIIAPSQTPPAESSAFLKEINRDIWLPFSEAYATGDADKYIALHAPDFIRAEGNDQQLNDLTGYGEGVRQGFQRGIEAGGRSAIAFRFLERFSNGKTASERGIYQYTWFPKEGESRRGYGKFHVISRKDNGKWKIIMDYDSNEGGTVDEADFWAAKGLGDM